MAEAGPADPRRAVAVEGFVQVAGVGGEGEDVADPRRARARRAGDEDWRAWRAGDEDWRAWRVGDEDWRARRAGGENRRARRSRGRRCRGTLVLDAGHVPPKTLIPWRLLQSHYDNIASVSALHKGPARGRHRDCRPRGEAARAGGCGWYRREEACPGHEQRAVEAYPGNRRSGLSRQPSLRPARRAGARGALRRQLFHRPAGERRPPDRQAGLRAPAPRRDLPALRRGRRDLQPRLSGVARCTTSSIPCRRRRRACTARSTCSASPSARGRRCSRPRPARSTAIPTVHPQTEDYWGNVNPIGPRSCYDEGKRCAETLFFDYHRQHGLRDQGRADLQHLRPAHAPERRARGVELHRPGAEGRADHHLRRRQPDAVASATSTT